MEDLPELVDFMLQRLDKKHQTKINEISKEAMEKLKDYSWPGNVRELENILHSASVVCKGKRIISKDLPSNLQDLTKQSVIEDKQIKQQNDCRKATTQHPNCSDEFDKPVESQFRAERQPKDETDYLFSNHPTRLI